MSKSILRLYTSKQTLEMPLASLLWKIYCLATYPAAIGVGYYIGGTNGAILVAALLALMNRGRL